QPRQPVACGTRHGAYRLETTVTRRPRSGEGDIRDARPRFQLLQMLRLVNSQIGLLFWHREPPILCCQECGSSLFGPGQGGGMAIRRGQARTGNGAAARRAAAAAATAADADRQADLIRLGCQISSDGLAVVTIAGDLDLATVDETVRYVNDVIDRHD